MFLPHSNYAGKLPRRTLARHFITPLVRPGMLAAWLLLIGVIPTVANAAAPTAVDVYAATQMNTSSSPQSALVVLEGADSDFDALTYRIVSGPGNGSLSDPGNGDATVASGEIAGQSVTYTPNAGFTGTDTFTYRVNDGTVDSTVQNATITVFDAWREVQRQLGADIDGAAAGDESGFSVTLSNDGQTVAIGALLNDGTADDAGHVRVYQYTGSAWTQLGANIDGEAAGGWAGFSVALSSDGQTLAIGARFNDGTADDAGHVRVYQYTGSVWTQLGADIDGEATGDWSGTSVALSSTGQTLAIGARFNDGTADNAGHVRVYQYTGSAWTQLGADIDGEAAGDQSGVSVALSSTGQTVAIGAHLNDGTADNAGHVRVYQYTGSTWTQLGADIDGEATGDQSGISVGLSSAGQTLAIGARLNDGTADDAGHVRVYQYTGSTWTQLGADIDGEAEDDQSGDSVALSSAGRMLAIGARLNDGTADNAGHVRVYQYTGSTWTQLGADIDGEAAGDQSGISVALSSHGQTVAIGAYLNDGTADDAGHVRVFRLDNLSPVITGATGTTATTGIPYLFTPSASDTDGDLLMFSITNQPGWTAFDNTTGALSGSPDAGDVGVTSGIVITVTDADGLAMDLAAFNLTVLLDTDEDEDGIGDALDACDNTPPAETGQVNGVGCGPSERDTDSDGTNDDQDAFPDNPDEQLDSDGDGYGDNEETEAGSDPNDADDQPISPGFPIWLLHEATK